MFAKILTLIPTVFKAFKIVGLSRDIVLFTKELKEAVEALSTFVYSLQSSVSLQGRQALTELDQALEKLADIVSRIPGCKKAEQNLRDLIEGETI